MQHGNVSNALSEAFLRALRAGDDQLIRQALAEASGDGVFRILSVALDHALQSGGDSGLQLRMFAIPILIVTGGQASTLSGVIPDIPALTKLFAAHGTLGPMKNFALSAALASAGALLAMKFSELYRRSSATGGEMIAPLELPPDEIRIAGAGEEVHLRFLTGVAVSAADAPGFTETAGDIGAWGMPFTKALATQLAQPGLSLLPLPRPPMSPLRALAAGKFAQCEVEFQLFLSAALRAFRARVGEAEAHVAACADGSIRIRLSSAFDATLSQEFRWAVQLGDEMRAVSNAIFSLLEQCRVMNVQVLESVQTPSAPR